MILGAIILAAAVLELGLLAGFYRQGRVVAERDQARRELAAAIAEGRPMTLPEVEHAIARATELPPGDRPRPVRPSPMRSERW